MKGFRHSWQSVTLRKVHLEVRSNTLHFMLNAHEKSSEPARAAAFLEDTIEFLSTEKFLMSFDKDTDIDPARQHTIENLLKLIADLVSTRVPTAPAIVPHALYTSQQVEENIGMSDVTLASWREFNGLFAMKPGTSKYLFYGEDVINFCRLHASGDVIVPRDAKKKAALRKAKTK